MTPGQQLAGDLEETDASGQLISTRFLQTGIHSHDDGVMHWHPNTSRAVGKNAKLGVFLDVYGVELDNDSLKFPDNQLGGQEFIEGETKCGTEDGELQVVVWDSYSDTDDGTTYIANFDNIPIRNDGMVFAIAFVPRDTDVQMPPWAADLPTLGAADVNQVRPEDLSSTTVPPARSAAPSPTARSRATRRPTTTSVAATTTVAATTGTSTP